MSRTTSLLSWTSGILSFASLCVWLGLVLSPASDPRDPEVSFELPEMMKPPQLSLPETPLLKPQSSQEMVSRYALRAGRIKLHPEPLMNGELDRFRPPPHGSTDPDSMWKGQVDRASRTLQETGMGHLNLRKP